MSADRLSATFEVAAVDDSFLYNRLHVIVRSQHQGRRIASDIPIDARRFDDEPGNVAAMVESVVQGQLFAHEAYWGSKLWC